MGMIWKGKHVLIKGQTADNAYQSKKQALRSKEQFVELRNRYASSHTSREEFRFFFASLKGHAVSVTLNERSLKQPGFLLRAGLLSKLSN